jgi:hypothetical protein
VYLKVLLSKYQCLVVHNLNKTKTLAGKKIILARNGDRKIKKRTQHRWRLTEHNICILSYYTQGKCQFFLQHKDREWSFATIVFKGSRKNVFNLFSIVNSKHLFLCCCQWSNSSKFMSMLSNFPQILLLCYELKL